MSKQEKQKLKGEAKRSVADRSEQAKDSKPNKRKTGRQNYNWGKIRNEYIADPNMSLKKIAEKYNIRRYTVEMMSSKEGWYEKRKEYQRSLWDKALAKTGEIQSDELAQDIEFLRLMKGHMERVLKDEDQFHRHLVVTSSVDKDGMVTTTEEKLYEKADTRAMRDAAAVMQVLEAMTRSLYNIQKADALLKQQQDAERLQMERERLEFEKQKADVKKPDDSNSIKIEGYESEWSE